ncbi:SRPBCC family protein [Mycobacterium sp. NPDC050853]|uniref:SRPBCC family protein n=1 Tax=Mycobacteriaceae TaxID=1762 RepID=UPI0015DFC0DD|nr:SRPBCC family protein [Mycobacteroides sp. LB1]
MKSSQVETVERMIAAAPGPIFALLTDPNRHREFDGSGAVRAARADTGPLVLGSTFSMSMKAGLPYRMTSTVVEYEKDRRIAWQTRGPTALGKYVAGRVWRYELEPVDGGTLVRESWDISRESPLTRPLISGLGAQARLNMEATLAGIEKLVADR